MTTQTGDNTRVVRSMETLTMPKPMSNTCSMMWRSVKISSQQDAILIINSTGTLAVWCLRFVYYVYAYAIGQDRPNLWQGEKVNFTVQQETLEISWQLSSWLQISLPVGKLSPHCAKWLNVLTDWNTYVYDKKREFRWPPAHQWISGLFKTWATIFHLVGNDATRPRVDGKPRFATGQYQLSNFDANILDLLRLHARMSETAAERSSGSMKRLITSEDRS